MSDRIRDAQKNIPWFQPLFDQDEIKLKLKLEGKVKIELDTDKKIGKKKKKKKKKEYRDLKKILILLSNDSQP